MELSKLGAGDDGKCYVLVVSKMFNEIQALKDTSQASIEGGLERSTGQCAAELLADARTRVPIKDRHPSNNAAEVSIRRKRRYRQSMLAADCSAHMLATLHSEIVAPILDCTRGMLHASLYCEMVGEFDDVRKDMYNVIVDRGVVSFFYFFYFFYVFKAGRIYNKYNAGV